MDVASRLRHLRATLRFVTIMESIMVRYGCQRCSFDPAATQEGRLVGPESRMQTGLEPVLALVMRGGGELYPSAACCDTTSKAEAHSHRGRQEPDPPARKS